MGYTLENETFHPGKHLMGNTANPEISLEALQAGDRSEFARLVDAYSPQIYRLALKMLGQPQDAEARALDEGLTYPVIHLQSRARDFVVRHALSSESRQHSRRAAGAAVQCLVAGR